MHCGEFGLRFFESGRAPALALFKSSLSGGQLSHECSAGFGA